MSINGVKHRRLSKTQINDGINDFIGMYLDVGKSKMSEHVNELLRRGKSGLMGNENPVSVLMRLKKVLRDLPYLDVRNFYARSSVDGDSDVADRSVPDEWPAEYAKEPVSNLAGPYVAYVGF